MKFTDCSQFKILNNSKDYDTIIKDFLKIIHDDKYIASREFLTVKKMAGRRTLEDYHYKDDFNVEKTFFSDFKTTNMNTFLSVVKKILASSFVKNKDKIALIIDSFFNKRFNILEECEIYNGKINVVTKLKKISNKIEKKYDNKIEKIRLIFDLEENVKIKDFIKSDEGRKFLAKSTKNPRLFMKIAKKTFDKGLIESTLSEEKICKILLFDYKEYLEIKSKLSDIVILYMNNHQFNKIIFKGMSNERKNIF